MQIDVSVNAPITGTITETHANEEDTVTVGQDLCNMEPGDAPEGSSGGFLDGIGDKLNSAAGGGAEGEKNEDYLDKYVSALPQFPFVLSSIFQ